MSGHWSRVRSSSDVRAGDMVVWTGDSMYESLVPSVWVASVGTGESARRAISALLGWKPEAYPDHGEHFLCYSSSRQHRFLNPWLTYFCDADLQTGHLACWHDRPCNDSEGCDRISL
jgi:hypothetical protein